MQSYNNKFTNDLPTVVVMMATYNGEKYLEEQLQTIINQDDVNVIMYARDDGSTDHTMDVLKKHIPIDRILQGNHDGSADNFWNLLRYVSENCKEEYYAWADQDDIWDSDKLKVAIERLRLATNDNKKPALYSSNNRKIDSNGNAIVSIDEPEIHLSTLAQVLIKSNVQGATMVFNRELTVLASQFTPEFKKHRLYHDAWLHKLCYALDGIIIFDESPHISYRIHQDNVIGKIQQRGSAISRFNNVFKVQNPEYSSYIALTLLKQYKKYLPTDSIKVLKYMVEYKNNHAYKRKIIFSKLFSTGNFSVDIKFKFAVLVNRA